MEADLVHRSAVKEHKDLESTKFLDGSGHCFVLPGSW